MQNLIHNPVYNVLLLLTVGGEFLLPWILKRFYKAYDPKTMVMSVIGSPQSPVRSVYNAWLLWLGCFLAFTARIRWADANAEHPILAVLLFVTIGAFAIGAGVIAGLFSVSASRDEATTDSKIHGAGSAVGFTALLFFPLMDALLAFKRAEHAAGAVSLAAFVLALASFTAFITGDKERFKNTVLANAGIWERVSLLCMYIPFIFASLRNLLSEL